MSLLFLKPKVSFLLVLINLASIFNATANDRITKSSVFFDQLVEADAYMLYTITDISYSKLGFSFRKNTSISYKMVFNNRPGVENYAYFNVSKSSLSQIKSFGIKTAKADGSLAEIDSADVFKYKPTPDENGQIFIPIPGIEPGDTLELNVSFSEIIRDTNLGAFILPYRDIPNLVDVYKISIPTYLHLDLKKYNNFPDPLIETTDALVTCSFRLENLPGEKTTSIPAHFASYPMCIIRFLQMIVT